MLDIFYAVIIALALLIDFVYLVVLVSINLPAERTKLRKLGAVSVIIPSRNGRVIEKTLRTLRKVKRPKLEVVVVSASKETLNIARKYGAKTVRDKGVGKGAALNAAVRRASNKILYFMDEDMIVRADTIEKVCSALDEYEVAVGYNLPENRGTLTAGVARLYINLLSKIQSGLYRMIGTTLVGGRNLAIYKSTLNEVGGFKNMLTEDMELSFKLYEKGKKVKFVNAVAFDQVPEKFSSYLKQQQRWNAGTGQVLKEWEKKLHHHDIALMTFLLLLGFLAPISLIFLLVGLTLNSLLVLSVPLIAFLLCTSSTASLGRYDLVRLPAVFFAFLFVHTFTVIYSKFSRPKGWYVTPKK